MSDRERSDESGELLPEPSPAHPAQPKGHRLFKCKCRVCTRIRADFPEAVASSPQDGLEEAGDSGDRGPQPLIAAPREHTRGRPKKIIAEWMALRMLEPNITAKEAASRLGIPHLTLNQYIHRATKEGWLKFDDTLDRLEFQIIPKIMDGYEALLAEGDKTAVIEGMKGTAFKLYQEAKGVKDVQQTVLSLKMETPTAEAKVVLGTIVGRPKYSDEDEEN